MKTKATKDKATNALVPKLRFPEFRAAPLRSVQLGDVTEESLRRNGKKHSVASVMGVSKADGIETENGFEGDWSRLNQRGRKIQ